MRLNNRKVIEALIRSGSFDSLGKSRAALTAGVDSAMDVATAERKSNDSGQGGLFGDEASHDHADRFPDLPEWSPDERIRYEKETLGFYITGHPLARFEEEIGLFGDVTAENAAAKVDQNVKIVALLASLKKTQIKKGQNEGKMMAKGVLEDLTGSVPVTIFASLLERVGPWLAEGRPVLVSGVVRSSSAPGAPEPEEGGGIVPVEIIAREIQALEGMREAAACEVRLTTPLPGTLDETLRLRPRDPGVGSGLGARVARGPPRRALGGDGPNRRPARGPADARDDEGAGTAPRTRLGPLRVRPLVSEREFGPDRAPPLHARAVRPEEPDATAYLVGGAVRDLLLRREPVDLDVARRGSGSVRRRPRLGARRRGGLERRGPPRTVRNGEAARSGRDEDRRRRDPGRELPLPGGSPRREHRRVDPAGPRTAGLHRSRHGLPAV